MKVESFPLSFNIHKEFYPYFKPRIRKVLSFVIKPKMLDPVRQLCWNLLEIEMRIEIKNFKLKITVYVEKKKFSLKV